MQIPSNKLHFHSNVPTQTFTQKLIQTYTKSYDLHTNSVQTHTTPYKPFSHKCLDTLLSCGLLCAHKCLDTLLSSGLNFHTIPYTAIQNHTNFIPILCKFIQIQTSPSHIDAQTNFCLVDCPVHTNAQTHCCLGELLAYKSIQFPHKSSQLYTKPYRSIQILCTKMPRHIAALRRPLHIDV